MFAFVVLHYMSAKDTIECVNSILNNVKSTSEYRIIVVDNGSPDGSLHTLQSVLTNPNVVIIHNERNLGFAKGNNTGFLYAKNKLNADFVALLNNDTCIYQEEWIDKCIKLYDQYHYAVLGPDIINLKNEHQNPFIGTQWTISKLRWTRFKQYVKILLLYCGFTIRKKPEQNQSNYTDNLENVYLHGACWIFSPIYINKFDGLYDKTFLYMEEEILKLRLDKSKMCSLYSPELQITHKEDRSTQAAAHSNKEMEINKIKNWIHSSHIFEDLIKG